MAVVKTKLKSTKTENRNTHRRYSFWSILCLVITAFIQIYAVTLLYRSMTNVDSIPVRQLQVDGELEYLTEMEIRNYFFENYLKKNLFTMQPIEVRTYLEKLEWIDTVYVRKKLPDILHIFVSEHKPIAYFNNGILTNTMKVIYPTKPQLHKEAVHLYGRVEEVEHIYEKYKHIESILLNTNFKIESLFLSDSYSWQLVLNNGVVLKLGREINENDDTEQIYTNNDILKDRIKLFLELYQYIDNKENIEYIDLRYETGVAVKWKDIEGTAL
jgi:cell division protein FtsQ